MEHLAQNRIDAEMAAGESEYARELGDNPDGFEYCPNQREIECELRRQIKAKDYEIFHLSAELEHLKAQSL